MVGKRTAVPEKGLRHVAFHHRVHTLAQDKTRQATLVCLEKREAGRQHTPGRVCTTLIDQLPWPPLRAQTTRKDVISMPSNAADESNPGRSYCVVLQVAFALVCAGVTGWLTDWQLAVHILLGLIRVFTSINRAKPPTPVRCTQCGRIG